MLSRPRARATIALMSNRLRNIIGAAGEVLALQTMAIRTLMSPARVTWPHLQLRLPSSLDTDAPTAIPRLPVITLALLGL